MLPWFGIHRALRVIAVTVLLQLYTYSVAWLYSRLQHGPLQFDVVLFDLFLCVLI